MRLFEHTDVKGRLLPLEKVRMFADFPAGWTLQNAPDAAKAPLIAAGEEALGKPLPPLPASLYRQFVRLGNRAVFEAAYFYRRQLLMDLLFAEAAEGEGRFLDGIVDALWAILEETTWVLPAHNSAACSTPSPATTCPG